MKKFVVAAVLAVGFAAPAVAQPIVLKAHTYAGPQAPEMAKNLTPWAEKVAKLSNGKLKIEIYPNMQLGGKPGDLPQQLDDGVVDIIVHIPGYSPGRFAGVEGLELPFTNVGTAAGQSAAAYEWATRWLQDADFKNIKVLSIQATDPSQLHMREKAVARLDDLKGLKIRVPSRVVGDMVQALGASPVGIPLSATYEALSRGQADGMFINWVIMPPYRLHEVTKFHLDTPIYQTPIMMLMSRKSYDRLPADLKKIVDESTGLDYSRQIGVQVDELKDAAIETVRKAGGTIQPLPTAERDRWVAIVKPAYQSWIENMNKRGLPGQKMFDDLLETTTRHGRK